MIKPPVMMLVSRLLFVRMMFLEPVAAPAETAICTMTPPVIVWPDEDTVTPEPLMATVVAELTPFPVIQSHFVLDVATVTADWANVTEPDPVFVTSHGLPQPPSSLRQR